MKKSKKTARIKLASTHEPLPVAEQLKAANASLKLVIEERDAAPSEVTALKQQLDRLR